VAVTTALAMGESHWLLEEHNSSWELALIFGHLCFIKAKLRHLKLFRRIRSSPVSQSYALDASLFYW
jgi:hypothetical protein